MSLAGSAIDAECSNRPVTIRVASVPASHVYIRHLAHPGVQGVTRLTDPRPADGRTVPGGWWPPVMLEPGWIDAHADEFDLFHIHFGFDALTPGDLRRVVDRLRAHRKPLVYTIHDLRNPHHPNRAAHDAMLDVLVPSADALVTLTAGAAEEIERRWGRSCLVLPHPHVVPVPWLERPRPVHSQRIVGIHFKSLRASMDPLPVVEALASELTGTGVVIQVNVHDEILKPDNYWYAPSVAEWLREAAQWPGVRIVVHSYFDDEELWNYLASIDVSVLPYQFGTHSGWLEACHDLGTAVVAPDCGFYDQQRPCHVYSLERAEFAKSLGQAVCTALRGDSRRPGEEVRLAERWQLAVAHRQLYRGLLP